MKLTNKYVCRICVACFLLINVRCTVSDDLIAPECGSFDSVECNSGSIEISAKEKMFYALSMMKRIEQQIALDPCSKTIDYAKFDFAYKMFTFSNSKELISSNMILTACRADEFYNRDLHLDDNTCKHRRNIVYDCLSRILAADKDSIPYVLNDYFVTYGMFIRNNKIDLQMVLNEPHTTRTAGVEYTVSLITPVGEYKIFCGNDEYIQDAAEENGIDLPSSCRCGYDIAGAAKLSKGKVDLSENYCLTEDEKSRGYCLIDVSKPLTDCVLYTHKESELLIAKDLPEVEIVGNSEENESDPDAEINWEELYNTVTEIEPVYGGGGGGNEYELKKRFKKFMDKLTAAEKELVKKHPVEAAQVAWNAVSAEDLADFYYKNNGVHNGLNDAFRHMVWSAYNSYDIGFDLAKEFVDAHEMNPNQPQNEREMDEHNNHLGLNIGIYARNNGYGKGDISGIVLNNMGSAKTL